MKPVSEPTLSTPNPFLCPFCKGTSKIDAYGICKICGAEAIEFVPTPQTKEQNDWQYELIKRFTSPGHANVHSIRQMKLDHEVIGKLIVFIKELNSQAILQERNRIVEIVETVWEEKYGNENMEYSEEKEFLDEILKALSNPTTLDTV